MASRKVIVAVHGIGEQFQYSTIQSVTYQFCQHFHANYAIPLGSFHAAVPFRDTVPPWPKEFENLAFAEVYWGDVPRRLVREGYTLEESKAWVRTLVARAGRTCATGTQTLRTEDLATLRTVLEEMVGGISLLERLLTIVERIGVLKFDLGRILRGYLGDVQVVTEFSGHRQDILRKFHGLMEQIVTSATSGPGTGASPSSDQPEETEIFIVAHSEGTVVAFLALLRALANPDHEVPRWAKCVRGFMTIGSPLEKHLILWPEIWRPFELLVNGERAELARPIEWQNYYDYGDPVGFDLSRTRQWLESNGWQRCFKFSAGDDHGFTRYWLPGKAHVDYWDDRAVFGHFLQNVVRLSPEKDGKSGTTMRPPRTRWSAALTSCLVPYGLAACLVFVAAFILYKFTYQYLDPLGYQKDRKELWTVGRKVGAMTALLCGTTLAARLFVLTRSMLWRVAGAIAFIAAAGGYYLLNIPPGASREYLVQGGFPSRSQDAVAVIVAASLLVFVVCALSKLRPRWGLRPLFGLATAIVVGIVCVIAFRAARTAERELAEASRFDRLAEVGNRRQRAGAPGEAARLKELSKERQPTIWPALVAGTVFLYLWWLATIVFDLTFVWHRYVRNARALRFLRAVVPSPSS